MWKNINNVLGRNRKENNLHTIIKDNGPPITDQTQIASEFNNYFKNIPLIAQSKLQTPKKNYLDLIPRSNKSMYLRPTNPTEVSMIILNLDNKKE